MIAFGFLLLGLVVGPHEIELVVGPPVSRVVVRLDELAVAHLDGPDFRVTLDLGDRLRPRTIEAVGYDPDGREVGRATQRVNVPRGFAHVALVLEGDDPRRPSGGRLSWQHIALREADVELQLDGLRLPVAPDGTFSLGIVDPDRLHTVAAEVRFADGTRYRAERSFGGTAGVRIDLEQTGVPVVAPYGMPTRKQLAKRFQIDDQPATVVGVEKGPASIVFVIDPAATHALRELAPFDLSAANVGLQPGERVTFFFPVAQRVRGSRAQARLFRKTRPFTAEDGDLAWLLTRVVTPEPRDDQALTDALATAILAAAEGSRPRAIVLVVSRAPTDRSAFGVDEVLAYARDLHVPLIPWAIGPGGGGRISEDKIPIAQATPWGPARDVTSVNRLVSALGDLRQLIDRQYTVWLEGAHRPNAVTLVGTGRGLTIAGRTD